jgi:hypothetical protein
MQGTFIFYIRSLDTAASCREYARYPFKINGYLQTGTESQSVKMLSQTFKAGKAAPRNGLVRLGRTGVAKLILQPILSAIRINEYRIAQRKYSGGLGVRSNPTVMLKAE